MKDSLPVSAKISYAFGMMGWSIMINLISVILIYLYLPPSNSGLPSLITQVTIFGFFNVIALITAGGRLVDAIYDPLIAQYSDRSRNPAGRRIPIMKWAVIPSMIFCFLVFYPLTIGESSLNILWLIICLVGFYISSTTYIIPYNALLPEMAKTSEEKISLSTFQSLGYVFGIGVAANAFNICAVLQQHFPSLSKLQALQLTVFNLVLLGGACMFITALRINEKKFTERKPSHVSLRKALVQALSNKNFLLFIIADFSYFVAITIITSGLMYFVTVLLRLPESTGNKLMITMVMVSLLFYPVINLLSKRAGKKVMMVVSFLLLSFVFLGIFFLGKADLSPSLQIYALVIFAAVPMASLNILPNALLAEIIQLDTFRTGENKEAMYFAVRYFFVKIAQTFGIALFAILLGFGKDTGNDIGIRLSGALGFGLCILAAIIFTRFREERSAVI